MQGKICRWIANQVLVILGVVAGALRSQQVRSGDEREHAVRRNDDLLTVDRQREVDRSSSRRRSPIRFLRTLS